MLVVVGGWSPQFEECVRDLEHEDVGVTVVVDYKDALYSPPHSKVFIVVLKPLQSCCHRGVFFWLSLLRAMRLCESSSHAL